MSDELNRLRRECRVRQDDFMEACKKIDVLNARVAELEAGCDALRAWLAWALENCDDSPEWTFGDIAAQHMRNLVLGKQVPMPEDDDARAAQGEKS